MPEGIQAIIALPEYSAYMTYLETEELEQRRTYYENFWKKFASHPQCYLVPPFARYEAAEDRSATETVLNNQERACVEAYRLFEKLEPPETRNAIYGTVSFLSTIAHLVSLGYLDKYHAWSRFFFTYRRCYEKLYPWYIIGIRFERYHGEKIAYATFEAMCNFVHEADGDEAFKYQLLKYQTRRLRLPVRYRFRASWRRLSAWMRFRVTGTRSTRDAAVDR